MRKLLAVSLLLLSACSLTPRSQKKLTDPTRPTIEIEQTSNVATAARHMAGGISVQYAVRVENPSKEVIRLRRITVESLSEGAYHVGPYSLPFDVPVASLTRESVRFWAPARTGVSMLGANGPVMLRVVCEFDAPSGQINQVVTRVVNRSTNVTGQQ